MRRRSNAVEEISKSLTYVWREVVGGLAVTNGSGVRPVTLLGVVAQVGLEREPGEGEQGRNDGRGVKGMMGMETLDAATVTHDIVAQLQVVVMAGCLIAENLITHRVNTLSYTF